MTNLKLGPTLILVDFHFAIFCHYSTVLRSDFFFSRLSRTSPWNIFFDCQGQDLWQPCSEYLAPPDAFFCLFCKRFDTGGLCFPFHGNTTEEDTFINMCTALLQIRNKNRNCIPLMFQTHFIDVQSRPLKVPQKLRKNIAHLTSWQNDFSDWSN